MSARRDGDDCGLDLVLRSREAEHVGPRKLVGELEAALAADGPVKMDAIGILHVQ